MGVIIETGPEPFQIFQQSTAGFASIHLAGRWQPDVRAARVELRILCEADSSVVCPWQPAGEQSELSWRHAFTNVSAGGLYRIETRLVLPDRLPEWGLHGDVIHHVGVGDLWLIAGQSNAAGYGRGPVHDPPTLGVHILKNNERWDIASHPLNDPTGSTHPNAEIANPGHSPYLAFARTLHATLHFPIGLIQTSLGNTALREWNPTENPKAPLYRNLLQCVRQAGGKIRGVLWYQGESDTNPGLAESYAARFARFVAQLRADLKNPQLPIVLAQSNRYTGAQTPEEHRGWSLVREAQRKARSIGAVTVVPTLDLPLSDDCHTSPHGNLVLGERKAAAALATVYGKGAGCAAPDVMSATLGIDRRTIDLTFAGVASRLEFIAPGEGDFAVEDERGLASIARAECVGADRVRLTLARPAAENPLVHGAYGANPSASLRDVETGLPMLGFYGMPCAEA